MSREITFDDLQRAAKLLSFPLREDRLKIIALVVNRTVEVLQPLTKLRLPKEAEPVSFTRLLEIIKDKKSEKRLEDT